MSRSKILSTSWIMSFRSSVVTVVRAFSISWLFWPKSQN
jgi:hypothetical protein